MRDFSRLEMEASILSRSSSIATLKALSEDLWVARAVLPSPAPATPRRVARVRTAPMARAAVDGRYTLYARKELLISMVAKFRKNRN